MLWICFIRKKKNRIKYKIGNKTQTNFAEKDIAVRHLIYAYLKNNFTFIQEYSYFIKIFKLFLRLHFIFGRISFITPKISSLLRKYTQILKKCQFKVSIFQFFSISTIR
jgi:hypothetical protein